MVTLNELELTKVLQRARYSSSSAVIALLSSHGWQLLGTGFEALVAQKPGMDYVLKLFESSSKYTLFVDYCQQQQGNPYLPKFGKYTRAIPGTRFSYVRMERLEPIVENQLLSEYPAYLCAIHRIFQDIEAPMYWNHALTPRQLDLLPSTHKFRNLDTCARAAPAQWTKTIQQLIDIMKQNDLQQFDLHSANMMLRGSTLVITDPFVKTT